MDPRILQQSEYRGLRGHGASHCVTAASLSLSPDSVGGSEGIMSMVKEMGGAMGLGGGLGGAGGGKKGKGGGGGGAAAGLPPGMGNPAMMAKMQQMMKSMGMG